MQVTKWTKEQKNHLGEAIHVDHHRDLERAVINEYGQVIIEGELGKKAAANYDKKYYEDGITATDDWRNTPTPNVITDHQNIFYVLSPLIPGFNLTRYYFREYEDVKEGDTIVLTHKRNKL